MKTTTMITRHAAAEMLGVTAQTISNWTSRGLIACTVMKGRRNNDCMMFERADVERLAERLVSIDRAEREIAETEKQLEEKRHRIDEEWKKVQEDASPSRGVPVFNYLARALIETRLGKGTWQYEYLNDFLGGMTTAAMAEKYHLTKERIRQKLNRAAYTLLREGDKLSQYQERCQELNEENTILTNRVALMQQEIDKLNVRIAALGGIKDTDLSTLCENPLFHKPVQDFDISLRLLNVLLSNDIQTIGQIMLMGRKELMKRRNMGRRCMGELEELIESLGLELKP